MTHCNKHIKLIDRASCWIFYVACALVLMIILLVFEQVLARYLWSSSSVAIQELCWYMFSFVLMLAIAHGLKEDSHVRVDLFYAKFSPRKKALIDLVSIVFLVWPVCFIAIYFGVTYTVSAFDFPGLGHSGFLAGEASPDPGGLAARWIPRSAIPIGFSLLFLQSCSVALVNLDILVKKHLKY